MKKLLFLMLILVHLNGHAALFLVERKDHLFRPFIFEQWLNWANAFIVSKTIFGVVIQMSEYAAAMLRNEHGTLSVRYL